MKVLLYSNYYTEFEIYKDEYDLFKRFISLYKLEEKYIKLEFTDWGYFCIIGTKANNDLNNFLLNLDKLKNDFYFLTNGISISAFKIKSINKLFNLIKILIK